MNITKDGKRVFRQLPALNFWRAPTDNDFGDWAQYNLRLWSNTGQNVAYKFLGTEGNTFKYEARPRGVDALVNLSYTVNNDGTLTIDAQYKALADDLPEMMRFGMMMSLPKSYENLSWYGRGPGESYIDRKFDQFFGVYSSKVSEQAWKYYRPQETGNKVDLRWLELKNTDGTTVKITGNQPLSASATNNRPEDLDPGKTKKQQHSSDVLPGNETVLCVDLFQRGMGGLQAWGANPLDEYRFFGKEYRYSYNIEIK
jgi:beta-galactosidase